MLTTTTNKVPVARLLRSLVCDICDGRGAVWLDDDRGGYIEDCDGGCSHGVAICAHCDTEASLTVAGAPVCASCAIDQHSGLPLPVATIAVLEAAARFAARDARRAA